ncbi:MAG: hypothetical protein EOO01_09780 [Chitinophagaceae bacterium]|nr:MAG: hypothetical protein EOO01_09780 [Chitinophagaceae bacterium]
MNFIKKLFGGSAKSKDTELMPARPLKLQFPLVPASAPEFAKQFVEIIRNNEQLGLNYSVGTLAFVDKFLDRFKREGITMDRFAETLFVAGCYVGQTMLANAGGTWIPDTESGLPPNIKTSPMLIRLANGLVADPVNQTFKRFSLGESESLMGFFHAFTQPKR